MSPWQAKEEAAKKDVLSVLGGMSTLETDDLLTLYAAASASREAWSPPYDVYPDIDDWTAPYDRESMRAWRIMEAVASKLATRQPDGCVHSIVKTLADWYYICDDDPKILAALLQLLEQSTYFRMAVAS